MPKPRTKSKPKVYRSAKTGRFVTEKYAKQNLERQ